MSVKQDYRLETLVNLKYCKSLIIPPTPPSTPLFPRT